MVLAVVDSISSPGLSSTSTFRSTKYEEADPSGYDPLDLTILVPELARLASTRDGSFHRDLFDAVRKMPAWLFFLFL